MAQAEDLIGTLKAELRKQRITYADVAEAIEISESSVKRMFATSSFTLRRLQQVCALIGFELSDLATLAEDRRRDVDELTMEQEKTLVGNPKLLLVAFLLLNYWTVRHVLSEYDIDDLEMVRILAKLDRLKIIDLLPGNKVRMRVSHTFSWRKDGPIQRLFDSQVQTEFLRSRFDGPSELRLAANGMIADHSIELMHQHMYRVMNDFEQCVQKDRRTLGPDRLGTTLVMAIRPWAFKMFEAYRRKKPKMTEGSDLSF